MQLSKGNREKGNCHHAAKCYDYQGTIIFKFKLQHGVTEKLGQLAEEQSWFSLF